MHFVEVRSPSDSVSDEPRRNADISVRATQLLKHQSRLWVSGYVRVLTKGSCRATLQPDLTGYSAKGILNKTHFYYLTLYRDWGTGVAQLVARLTLDRCVVGSSPTCGTEHFGFPPSAPRLGNQRPWYVQPRLCDRAKIPCHLSEREGDRLPVGDFLLVSFIK